MRTILYLGTDPTQFESQGHFQDHVVHFPIIKVIPRTVDHPEIRLAYDDLAEYTHLIFTSKNAVRIFFQHLEKLGKGKECLANKQIIAVGIITASYLSAQGFLPQFTAQKETQEGIIALLNRMDLDDAYFFLPRSSLSRPVLVNFFAEREIRFQACDLYDTVTQEVGITPDLERFDDIIFTSPSTVKAFVEIFGKLPRHKKLLAIGPITEQTLHEQISLENDPVRR